jgi:predicted AlkP superfamily phosphohydrolase/phosphomutase
MAKKTAKKTKKKSPAKPARKKPSLVATYDKTTAVAQFFDKVDSEVSIQAEIAANNQNIVKIAAKYGFAFSYGEMADHLRERWCIECGPIEHYCCF